MKKAKVGIYLFVLNFVSMVSFAGGYDEVISHMKSSPIIMDTIQQMGFKNAEEALDKYQEMTSKYQSLQAKVNQFHPFRDRFAVCGKVGLGFFWGTLVARCYSLNHVYSLATLGVGLEISPGGGILEFSSVDLDQSKDGDKVWGYRGLGVSYGEGVGGSLLTMSEVRCKGGVTQFLDDYLDIESCDNTIPPRYQGALTFMGVHILGGGAVHFAAQVRQLD